MNRTNLQTGLHVYNMADVSYCKSQ